MCKLIIIILIIICKLSLSLLVVNKRNSEINRYLFFLYSVCDCSFYAMFSSFFHYIAPGRVAQSVEHLTRKSGVLGSIPGLATYFRFSFRFFKKGSCQLLAKVCARSTG